MECHVSNGHGVAINLHSSTSVPESKTQGRATIHFEVAPDPDNQALVAQWRRLPGGLKGEITRRVAQAIVPEALAALNTKGELVEQTGGYLGETNPSLAVNLVRGKRGIEVAKLLGHVFAQQSVMVVSETCRKGLKGVDVITVGLPGGFTTRQVAALYDRLWSLTWNGERLITGHTTAEDEMLIMNFGGIKTSTLKARIDQCLGGAYPIASKKVYVAAVEKSDYGYDVGRRAWPIASGESLVLGRHNYLRRKVANILRVSLAQQ